MSASPYYDREIRRPLANVAQSQTDAEIWPSEPGNKLRVLAVYALGPTATAITFNKKSAGVSGVAISPAYTPAAAGVPTIELPFNPHGWFETEADQSLTVTTGSGGTTAISVVLASLYDGGSTNLVDEMRQTLLLENQSPILTEAG